MKVPSDVIEAYEAKVDDINLPSIEKREKVIKHDVKARIEEFNSLTGHQFIHIGLTSRDLTDNVELIQIKSALISIRKKADYLLSNIKSLIYIHLETPVVARTHNVPAQLTTLGKKFANFASELINGLKELDHQIENLKLRGIKGAVGTQQDLCLLFDSETVLKIEKDLNLHYGFKFFDSSIGQVYPRSQDFNFISSLLFLCSSVNSFALNLRLMSGLGYVSEFFEEQQVGSSAMPHKINPINSERINGLTTLLRGYCGIASEISGNQWNEGDVSCSVVRRVIIPDSIFVVDGILISIKNILERLHINTMTINKDIDKEGPYLASSIFLMKLVSAGIGREDAHKILKALALKSDGDGQKFLTLVSENCSKYLDKKFVLSILKEKQLFIGNAIVDCKKIIKMIEEREISSSIKEK